MLALAIFILLVAAVAVLSWTTRNKRLPVRCCNPAPWPRTTSPPVAPSATCRTGPPCPAIRPD